ncbi:MAG: hypothetical protein WKF51_11575 [Geodermatophilaceae bacterium]
MELVEKIRAGQLPPPYVRESIRRTAGASYAEMGAAMTPPVTGVTVWRWEQGKAVPRRDHAIAYRQLLDALRELVAS